MVFRHVYIFPIVLPLWFFVGILTTYIIAVYKKHSVPVLPYISDTGTHPPESCIFSLFLNVGALMQALVIYVRYCQIRNLFEERSRKKQNFCSLILGLCAASGVAIVANFQVTNVPEVHMFGAYLAFILGSFYMFLQIYMSFKQYPRLGGKTIIILRTVTLVICFLTIVCMSICGLIAYNLFNGTDYNKWDVTYRGYYMHLVSTTCEYILAIGINLFLLSYAGEFKSLTISEPEIRVQLN